MYEKLLEIQPFCQEKWRQAVSVKRKRGTTAVSFLFSYFRLYHLFSASSMLLRGSFLASVIILYTYSVIHSCEKPSFSL